MYIFISFSVIFVLPSLVNKALCVSNELACLLNKGGTTRVFVFSCCHDLNLDPMTLLSDNQLIEIARSCTSVRNMTSVGQRVRDL